MPLSDIEIARQAKMQPIENVAAKIGINRDQLLQYGPYKAKLSLDSVKEISQAQARQADPGDGDQPDACG